MANEILDQEIRQTHQTNTGNQPLPNQGGILTLGILAIVFFLGILGPIMGIISLSLASGAVKTYKATPDKYADASYRKVVNGRTCAIVGLSLSVFVWLIIAVVAIANA